MKFKYNAFENNSNIYGIATELIESFTKLCEEMYSGKISIFNNENVNIKNDNLIKALSFYQQANLCKVKIPSPEDKEECTVYKIIAVYLILLIEVTKEKMFVDIVMKFVFYFREYLNLTGWDYYNYLAEYGIAKYHFNSGEFCEYASCEEIPEMVNDFTTMFLELTPVMKDQANEIIDITQNFCYWLFINGFTRFKLSKIDENQLLIKQ